MFELMHRNIAQCRHLGGNITIRRVITIKKVALNTSLETILLSILFAEDSYVNNNGNDAISDNNNKRMLLFINSVTMNIMMKRQMV